MKVLTYADQIERWVLAAIRRGDLAPGERVSEERISHALEVSRTPVRQTLHQMSSSGLLDHRAHHGVFVPKLDHDRITHLGEVRIALETAASRTAITRGIDGDELKQLTDDVTGHQTAAPDQEVDFHRRWVRCAGNPELLATWDRINQQLLVARWLSGQRAHRAADATREHVDLVHLLRVGDVVAVDQLINRHVRQGIQAFMTGDAA